MSGWIGFWIMLGIIGAVDIITDYLVWRTKIEYDIKDEKLSFWKRIFKDKYK